MTGGFGLRISWLLVVRVSAAAHEATSGPVIRTAGTNLWAKTSHYTKLYEEKCSKIEKSCEAFFIGERCKL